MQVRDVGVTFAPEMRVPASGGIYPDIEERQEEAVWEELDLMAKDTLK